MNLCQVALPVHLDQVFDYLVPPHQRVAVGARVRVPFGSRQLVGIVVGHIETSPWPAAKLRVISAVLDATPLIDAALLRLARWLSDYYHHPLGEVLATMLPVALRQGRDAPRLGRYQWCLTPAGTAVELSQLARAPRQRQALAILAEGPASSAELAALGITSAVMAKLAANAWVEKRLPLSLPASAQAGPPLSTAQAQAVERIAQQLDRFVCHLLDGVTGSGKTEVYIHALAAVIEQGRQGLLIVPEIALTPQLTRRISARLGVRLGVLHSGLAKGERAAVWLAAGAGELDLVVGTRSAVLTPLAKAGLIVVDEEHDGSLKQHDGLRYSARDVAVQRAYQLKVPVLLGSATPALESLANVQAGRYQRLCLPARVGGAGMPEISFVDLRHQRCHDGLSEQLLTQLQGTLKGGEQVLLFLNRRGYAPILMCQACAWNGRCQRCDANLTLHRQDHCLRCHHCGEQQSVPDLCPACGSSRLQPIGVGTQRLEQTLHARLQDYPILRLDRDVTRRRDAMESILAQVRSGQPCVLLGTQMLAKGHDFPSVTLVAIVDMDQTLFSSDFRAAERAAQLLVQVAGRAGRASRPGRVILQTHHPHHPLFVNVLKQGYSAYAQELLVERRAAGFPPYGHMALVRAEAKRPPVVAAFLRAALSALPKQPEPQVFGPIPAPMEKRAGFHRQQLILLSTDRKLLQRTLARWMKQLYQLPQASRVRWSLDVDPQDMF